MLNYKTHCLARSFLSLFVYLVALVVFLLYKFFLFQSRQLYTWICAHLFYVILFGALHSAMMSPSSEMMSFAQQSNTTIYSNDVIERELKVDRRILEIMKSGMLLLLSLSFMLVVLL